MTMSLRPSVPCLAGRTSGEEAAEFTAFERALKRRPSTKFKIRFVLQFVRRGLHPWCVLHPA